MHILINISEEDYNVLHTAWESFTDTHVGRLLKAICDGQQLPKGHGRLIDADKTISKICGNSCGCHLEECGHDKPCYSVARINAAPTIIEADKDVENGNDN